MAWFHETGSLIGTAVSATFLLAMALVNMVILRGVWRSFQALKHGNPVQGDITLPAQGGVMNWLFGKTFRLVNKSWQMYLVGFLFGLGFDTATEIGVLGISAASASSGMSVWSIMIFPALFASGMALGLLMDKFALSGGVWDLIGAVNDNLGDAGFVVVGLFVACWLISMANYRWRGYDALVVRP